jgi:YhcH/YjgK/YiaL family protein
MMGKNSFSRNFVIVLASFSIALSIIGCSNKDMADTQIERDYMILDRLDQAERYFEMHPAFERAFAFLQQEALSEMSVDRHEINGDRMYCIVSKGPGRTREEAKLEAHRKYIDIQYIIAGTDEMGWKPTAACKTVETSYDADNDIEFFEDRPETWTKVPAGSFTIFFPQDAHAPMVSDGEVHKVILKISVEEN